MCCVDRLRRPPYSVAKLLFCGLFLNFSGMKSISKFWLGGTVIRSIFRRGRSWVKYKGILVAILGKTGFGENIDHHRFRVLQQNTPGSRHSRHIRWMTGSDPKRTHSLIPIQPTGDEAGPSNYRTFTYLNLDEKWLACFFRRTPLFLKLTLSL